MSVTIESNAIIKTASEAMCNAADLSSFWNDGDEAWRVARAIVAAVTPLIRAADAKLIEENVADLVSMTRAAALEEAAQIAEDVDRDVAAQNSASWSVGYFAQHIRGTAAAIRALKEQP